MDMAACVKGPRHPNRVSPVVASEMRVAALPELQRRIVACTAFRRQTRLINHALTRGYHITLKQNAGIGGLRSDE